MMYWILAALIVSITTFRLYLHFTDQHVHFHWQNLSEKKPPAPLWRYGRCWWNLFPNNENKQTRYPSPTINPTWSILQRSSTAIGFDFASEEDDFTFHIAIDRLFSIWLTLAGMPFLHKLFKEIRQGFGYETSIKFYDSSIWIHVAYNELYGAHSLKGTPDGINVWIGRDRKTKEGFGFYVSVHYLDILLGRQKYSDVKIGSPVDVEVVLHPDTTMLGRKYIARVQMVDASWKRARWPWTRTIRRAEIECIPPIPEPGKGENSWDQDDDAVYSLTCAAANPSEGVEKLIASVQRERQKYGYPNEIYEAFERASRF
jgi:hypothetical protein